MAVFTIAEVVSATGGKLRGAAQERFTGVATDTRKIQPGNLFVALQGERFDGHDFISQAVERGAGGVLASRTDMKMPEGVPVIYVEDTLQGLQQLARFHRLRFSIPLIAVTGSNGKTTTKDMIAAVLSSRFHVLKTEANFNNEIGLSLTLLNLDSNHDAAVVEIGMRGQGQLRELAKIALPTMAVITNVSETHIELLGSIENIAAAKAELVEAIPETGVVFLNGDDSYVKAMSLSSKARVVEYGILGKRDVWADAIRNDGQGMTFHCHGQVTFTATVSAAGRHNVYNALAAIAVGVEMKLTVEEIKRGLQAFSAGAMRLSIEKLGEYVIINDAYNASPLSMSAAIDTLAEVAKGRSIAVLGDMLELGHIAIEAHRRIGRKLAEQGVKIVITVGELARNIAESAHEYGIVNAVACQTHSEAIKVLQQYIKPGDTLLIKGSRGMKMEQILKMFGE
ncbi:MAG: UDP-N-acetylmuramoyl-tripeptide--D-alanyl-D-alanine ligase [Veillonellales bacterium]